jgi:hypothetical protein
MFGKVQALLEWRATLLLSGRFDDLASTYFIPKVAFLEGRQLVLTEPEDMVAVLRELATKLRLRGVVRLIPSVKALEIPRNGRFRVWVHWEEISGSPANDGTSDAIYYFRETEAGLRSEMVDFSRVSRPEYRFMPHGEAAAR